MRATERSALRVAVASVVTSLSLRDLVGKDNRPFLQHWAFL
jgi:hypothetical protein